MLEMVGMLALLQDLSANTHPHLGMWVNNLALHYSLQKVNTPKNDLEMLVSTSLQVCSLETYVLPLLQNIVARWANSVAMMILQLLLMVYTWVMSVSSLERLLHLVMSVARSESTSETLVNSSVMRYPHQLLGSRMERSENMMGRLGNMMAMLGNTKGTWWGNMMERLGSTRGMWGSTKGMWGSMKEMSENMKGRWGNKMARWGSSLGSSSNKMAMSESRMEMSENKMAT